MGKKAVLPTDETLRIAAALKETRERLGLTQGAVAERMETSQNNISQWEAGVRAIDLGVFLKWCRALDLDPRDLL